MDISRGVCSTTISGISACHCDRCRAGSIPNRGTASSNQLPSRQEGISACCLVMVLHCTSISRRFWTSFSSGPDGSRTRRSGTESERAVSRVRHVNPAHRICRNQLDRDGACLDGTLIADEVHVVTTRIDNSQAQ